MGEGERKIERKRDKNKEKNVSIKQRKEPACDITFLNLTLKALKI